MTVSGAGLARDPKAIIRGRGYAALLVLAALIGAPVAAIAYLFLAAASWLQRWIFGSLPAELGLHPQPRWWPIPPLIIAGLLVAVAIRYLPGKGGRSLADGFSASEGAPGAAELPGIALAALATLALGAVLGPEAPLIAIGGGLGALAVRLVRPGAPAGTRALLAAAGGFAAISTLLGSPVIGAFLLMEAAGLAGGTLELVLVPGLLAAGIGSLIFTGLDALTGLGTFSLAIGGLPKAGTPTVSEFGWAIVIGLAAALLGSGIHWLGAGLRTRVERVPLLATPVAGLVVALLAIAFAAWSGKSYTLVLFSGQTSIGPLITGAAGYSAGALVLLLACKAAAYGISLSGFRGGPTFPAMFLGAAGGIALSHLAGLTLVAGAAMGIGAMAAVMLRLPLTSVLLATLLLASDGVEVMPLAIVAVIVAYVTSERLLPPAPATRQG